MSNNKLRSVDHWQIFAAQVFDYAFILLDSENCVADWNPGAERMLGYTRDQILGQTGAVFFTPEDRIAGEHLRELEIATQEGRAEDERWHLRKDGTRFRASGIMAALRDEQGAVIGFAKVMRDVTAREEAREQLEISLRERTALLREVHHRVKNNLQMILSLIRLQADRVTDPQSQLAFEDTVARVRAIAGVHELVYASPDLSTIHVEPYFRGLIQDVERNCNTYGRVEIQVDVPDLALDVRQALPLALITNELLSNAIRHGLPDGQRGFVFVTVRYLPEGPGSLPAVRAEIRDNGVGLPKDVDFNTSDSIGFDLVRILAVQLRASVSVTTGSAGTVFTIELPLSLPDEFTPATATLTHE